MDEAVELVEALQPIVYGLLAVVTLLRWSRLRDAASAWAAGMFGVLGVAVGASRWIPDDDTGVALWEQKLLIAGLVLFPYLLFRFGSTFREPGRPLWVAATVLAAASSLSIFLFEDLAGDGERATQSFTAYTVLVIGYWVWLSAIVAFWFWRAGVGRPTVARQRMRTLSVGIVALALALLLAGFGGDDDGEAGLVQLVVAALAVLAGPLFLMGLAPPAALLDRWRRSDEAALRSAEAALVAANSPEEVAGSLLPYVARTLGGNAAVLVGSDGSLLAAHGVDEADGLALVTAASSEAPGSGASVTSIEMRSGKLFVVGDRYTPFFGREERQVLVRLANLTDVALRRAHVTAAELTTAAETQRANTAMREFVSIASHDLRTPIAVVKGFASTLVTSWDRTADDEKLSHIGTIARQADHLSRIVSDLLTTSQLDAGAVEPHLEILNLRELVEEVQADLGQEAAVHIGEHTSVLVDEAHAERIIRNLLENAWNYGEPPVEVTALSSGDHVELRVRDHGAGIGADFRPRLFDRFARADTSASKAKHGTGLGLSIVRGLARAGGGDAWYEPGFPGACFVVRFTAGEMDR